VDATVPKQGSVPAVAHAAALSAVERVGAVLGLGLDEPRAFLSRVKQRRAQALGISEAWVEERILARTEARKSKDFARADAVRGELAAAGVELLDTPEGTDWRLTR
jgi:cysteinyl-tRNA synthetase